MEILYFVLTTSTMFAPNLSDESPETPIEFDQKHMSNPSSDQFKIIALVNVASGAKKGLNLVKQFKKYKFSVYNVKDLSLNDLMRETLADELFKYKDHCVVVICGGDGTNVWASSLIDQSISEASKPITFPPIATMPMGTGNDLSRTLGWGNMEPKRQILDSVGDIAFAAQIAKRWSYIDRWSVTCTINDSQNKLTLKSGQQMPSTFVCFCTYLLPLCVYTHDCIPFSSVTYRLAMTQK